MADSAVTVRPPGLKLTSELEDAIVGAIGRGTSITSASALAGVSESTIRQWLHVGSTGRYLDGTEASEAAKVFLARFSERIALARANFEAQITDNLHQAGFRELKSGATDWRAHLDLMRYHPDWRTRWREHKELKVEHSGAVSLEHRAAAQLSPAQLLEVLPAEWRELVPAPVEEDGSHAISHSEATPERET